MIQLQITSQFNALDLLHKQFGDPSLSSIYGAGKIKCPRAMFLFMNPTGRNVAAVPGWQGIRAPWLGTKNVWKVFAMTGVISDTFASKIVRMDARTWSPNFCGELYEHIAKNGFFVTNLAKCTQFDARPLKNFVFEAYLAKMLEEIDFVKPEKIISFGNQVSSILLQRTIRVSDYLGIESEQLRVNGSVYNVFPTYYPVGQGMPNLPKAVERIRKVLEIG